MYLASMPPNPLTSLSLRAEPGRTPTLGSPALGLAIAGANCPALNASRAQIVPRPGGSGVDAGIQESG